MVLSEIEMAVGTGMSYVLTANVASDSSKPAIVLRSAHAQLTGWEETWTVWGIQNTNLGSVKYWKVLNEV